MTPPQADVVTDGTKENLLRSVHVRAVLVRMGQNDHTTGACKTGVKVRITRQRMVGRIARHSSADIAAGVTTSHLWPFALYPMQIK